MPTDSTELSPPERELAQARLREMAEKFVLDEILRSPQWRAAFTRTWRHPYVPCYYPELGVPPISATEQSQRSQWLHAVYIDETLITKVVRVQFRPPLAPGGYPMYTCSSTAPVLMLTMLEALEVATERLAANGYTPTLATVDGASGYPPGAPYDRIIAACAVLAIPPAWLEQAAPGAVIVVDVHGKIGGTLARLTVNHDGVATGRFLPRWASFMSLRHTLEVQPPAPRPYYDNEPVHPVSAVHPTLLRYNGEFAFVTQWYLPDVTWGPASADGEFGIQLYAPDGCGSASRTPTSSGNRPGDRATTGSASPPAAPNNTSGTTTRRANTAGHYPPQPSPSASDERG